MPDNTLIQTEYNNLGGTKVLVIKTMFNNLAPCPFRKPFGTKGLRRCVGFLKHSPKKDYSPGDLTPYAASTYGASRKWHDSCYTPLVKKTLSHPNSPLVRFIPRR